MESKNSEGKLIEIFLFADDMCLEIEKIARQEGKTLWLPQRCGLCMSEMLTILVYYHHSGYKCFQYYYERMVMGSLRSHFPGGDELQAFFGLHPALSDPPVFDGAGALRAGRTHGYLLCQFQKTTCL
ncbi:MAG: hypothetical protein OHK0019_20450 [Saprospiraceae bacterium]